MDYAWAREVGLIRRPATFLTSITDERGDELMYSGVRISEIVRDNKGIGGVLGLLWFQRNLPDYFCKFLELCLIVTADHGPAVSGAHNTIVAARAGKDLVSSLASGLLTIGPRFGGMLIFFACLVKTRSDFVDSFFFVTVVKSFFKSRFNKLEKA